MQIRCKTLDMQLAGRWQAAGVHAGVPAHPAAGCVAAWKSTSPECQQLDAPTWARVPAGIEAATSNLCD